MNKTTPNGNVKTPLSTVTINRIKCRGCGVCLKKCPVGAVTGKPRRPHTINDKLCTSCLTCVPLCVFEAILVGEQAE